MTGASRTPEQDSPSQWKTIAWLIGPLAVVGIAAFIFFRPTSDAPPSQTPESSQPVAVATPTPFPTPDIRPAEAASLALQSAQFEEDATVAGFALAGDRVIATGSSGEDPAAWYSDDSGATWEKAAVQTLDPPRPGAVVGMDAVAVHAATLIAIGTWHPKREGQPLALSTWTSPDAGTTWTEEPRDAYGDRMPPFARQLLTATDFGFVAVHFTGFPVVMVSADGTTWGELEGTNDIAKAQFRDIVGRDDTLVAVGLDTSTTPSGILTPDAWTYTDAAGWTTLNDRFSGAIVGSLAADASGFYAAGMVLPDSDTTAGAIATIWESEDGTSWQQRILSQSPDRETGPIAHGSLGTLVTGDAVVSAPTTDDAAPTTFAWFVRNDAPDGAAQEYPIAWAGRAAVALPDRFIVFGVCPPQPKDCTGPAMLTFAASDKQYEAR